jgi:hypothetical protein
MSPAVIVTAASDPARGDAHGRRQVMVPRIDAADHRCGGQLHGQPLADICQQGVPHSHRRGQICNAGGGCSGVHLWIRGGRRPCRLSRTRGRRQPRPLTAAEQPRGRNSCSGPTRRSKVSLHYHGCRAGYRTGVAARLARWVRCGHQRLPGHESEAEQTATAVQAAGRRSLVVLADVSDRPGTGHGGAHWRPR